MFLQEEEEEEEEVKEEERIKSRCIHVTGILVRLRLANWYW